MSITSNELSRVKSFNKRVHIGVIYAYIVENKTQAQIASEFGFDDSWAVSAIVRAYNFNRERSDSYQGGRDKGKYRGTSPELVASYVSGHYPGFVEDDRVTFDDYLSRHRKKAAAPAPAAQRQPVRQPAPRPAAPVPPPVQQPVRPPTAEELFRQAIRLWLSGSRYRDMLEPLMQAADRGHAEAAYYMALYYNERGGSGDYAQAHAWLRKAIDRGHGEARREVARFLAAIAAGARQQRDYRTAALCYEQGARAGDAEAANRLGILYAEGEGGVQNWQQAAYWYDQAAKGGSMHGMYNLAGCYRNGHGVERSVRTAIQLYEQAAGRGHAEAGPQAAALAYARGERLLRGKPELRPKAYGYFQKAARYGHADADFYLGYCHANGIGTAADARQAYQYYDQAARRGSAAAHNNLGVLYARGEGTAQDGQRAADHYEQAAKLGDPVGMKNIAHCYANGKGREANPVQALYWFEQAAGRGNEEAKQPAADMAYRIGEQLWKSKQASEKAEAFGYYRKALDYGNRQALMKLGLCYEKGEGVEQSYEQAIAYYKQAEQEGIKDADEWLADGYLQYGIDRYDDGEYEHAIALFEQGAELGNDDCMCRLAECYFEGNGVEEDDERAAEWWSEAGDVRFSSMSASDYYMAAAVRCLERGEDERGLAWYRRAAALDHGEAMMALGDYYAGNSDYSSEIDYEQAAEWYKQAFEHDVDESDYYLEKCYVKLGEQALRNGRFDEARHWDAEAAEHIYGRRYRSALFAVCMERAEEELEGGRYDDALPYVEKAEGYADRDREYGSSDDELEDFYVKLGDYCMEQRQFSLAVQWYEKAGDRTDLESVEAGLLDVYPDENWSSDGEGIPWVPLSGLYRLQYGEGWVQPLLAFYERLAEHGGDSFMKGNLGQAYETGIWKPFDVPITPNAERAFHWYRSIVEIGGSFINDAVYRLAACYRQGIGTPQNPQKAVETLEHLASWGDPEALNLLGEMAFAGEGMPQDLDKTFDYCSRAAAQGHAEAQYNVGFCYEYGYGTERDLAKAMEWYTKSAEQGFALAVERLGEM